VKPSVVIERRGAQLAGLWPAAPPSKLEPVATVDTTSLDAEYRALTEGCGLLDRSERGKLALTGSGAKEFLAGQVTNEIEALVPGEGCYAAFLTPKGKMLGDLRILDRGEELLLDTERVALQGLFDMIRRFKIGYDVQLHKRTVERGLLSLLGPDAPRVAGVETLPDVEHANAAVEIDGIAAIVARTDTGVDLICDAADTDALAGKLRERGAALVSEQAAEILRVEHGRPRYGIDLDETVIPQEAGLNERAVSFTKGCYVGQETVARLHYRGKPNRHLRGLRLSEPVEPGAELHLGERVVGHLTSAVLSPAHGPIGLALVRREAEPGEQVRMSDEGASAVVTELPFVPASARRGAGRLCGGMRALVLDPPTAWLERRRHSGLDRLDEVWDGVMHMVPAPSGQHAYLAQQLAELLAQPARAAGLVPAMHEFNLGESEEDFRVPDGGLHRGIPLSTWHPTAPLVVEIVSPNDESWEKLPFYAAHDVDEMLIIDPRERTVSWLGLAGGEYKPIEHSGLIDLGARELAEQLDWPAVDGP
jgi:folate-binding protein YgfZ